MEPLAVVPFLVLLVGGSGIRLLKGDWAYVPAWTSVFGGGLAIFFLWGDRLSFHGVFLSDRRPPTLSCLRLDWFFRSPVGTSW